MVYKLIRTDAENPQKIKLTPGIHLIGRGANILECTDKRISRNHGNLKVTNDEITLKSLHQNPCYFIKKNLSETQILRQDCELNLNHGDQFGLLPDSYWYEVLLCTDSDTDLKPTIPAEENIGKLANDQSDTEHYWENSDDHLLNFDIIESVGNIENSESQSLISEEITTNDTNQIPSDKSSIQTQNNSKDPINSSHQNNQDSVPDSSRDLLEQESKPPKRLHTDSENEIEEKKVKLEREDVKPSIMMPGSSTDQVQSGDNGTPFKVQPQQQGRERCIYGASCYRKNPHHLAEFSHPSDADWGAGPRGSCPWGSRCRRRDPRHWQHHDHPPGTQPPSNRPGRATKNNKTKKPKKKDSYIDSSEGSSLEDSQDLIINGKRQRKTVILSTDWKASDEDSNDDPYQTDESDEWQPSGKTQSQGQDDD